MEKYCAGSFLFLKGMKIIWTFFFSTKAPKMLFLAPIVPSFCPHCAFLKELSDSWHSPIYYQEVQVLMLSEGKNSPNVKVWIFSPVSLKDILLSSIYCGRAICDYISARTAQGRYHWTLLFFFCSGTPKKLQFLPFSWLGISDNSVING